MGSVAGIREDEIKLKVYEADMHTVKKECKAVATRVPMGIVRRFMGLFDADKLNDSMEILNIIIASWEDVTSVMEKLFPDMSEEDWDYVDIGELVQVAVAFLKAYFKQMLKVPTEKN